MPASTDNIATFVEVVRRQSLSAAARSLGLPKSTVSRRLVRLEEELQIELLERDPRKLRLTAAGRRFYDAVVAPIDSLDQAVAALAQNQRAPRGTVRVTAPPDLGRMQLSALFVAFLERHPDIDLDLVLSSRMLDLVQDGIDLAVRAGRVADERLVARKLCDSELQLATGRAPRLLDEPKQLEAQPFVLYRAAGRRQTLKLERGVGKRRKLVEVQVGGRINVDDYAAMAELIAAGHGMGLLPAIHVQEGVREGRLTRVLPEWSSKSGQIFLVYATRQLPERARLLASFLLAEFAKVGRV